MNKFAVWVTKQEGKKISVSIAQVKEILKIALPPVIANCERKWKMMVLKSSLGAFVVGLLIGALL